MYGSGDVGRRGVTAAMTTLVASGAALVLLMAGFILFLMRSDPASPVPALLIGGGVLSSGIVLALSVWMIAIINDATFLERGLELQAHGVRNCQDVIVQLDEDLRIVALNPAAERKFAHTSEAAGGMPLGFVMSELAKQPAAEPPVPRPARTLVGEETKTSARRLAMRAGTRLSNLIQPLLGFTEIALESLEPNHPVRADLAEISRASSRVVLLAQSLEMFGGVRAVHTHTFDLNTFLEGLERDLRLVLQPTTAIELRVAGHPVSVSADPGLARTAVLLLACNAEDAMPPGSTVIISAASDGLRVADSGAGLSKDVRAALFHPLVSTKDAERGVGLGLHAARAAMQLQHGDLHLTESGESGSVFTLAFSLPVGPIWEAPGLAPALLSPP